MLMLYLVTVELFGVCLAYELSDAIVILNSMYTRKKYTVVAIYMLALPMQIILLPACIHTAH